MLKSYPKILPLVGKYFDLIKGKRVECTEKLDGSQFVFGCDSEGKLFMRSKGTPMYPEGTVADLFGPASRHVLDMQHRLPPGVAFYGETLKTPRHNTLAYNNIPRNHIALYGITDFERTGEARDHLELQEWADELEIDVVPLIGYYVLENADEVLPLIKRTSYLGGAEIEGVVLKDYSTPMEFSGMVYPFTAMKYVSDAFKEKHADNPDWTPSKSKVEMLLERYRTEARWEKAVQHVRDRGELLGEPKDIGGLIKELHIDLVEEERENFKEELYQIFQKDWKHTVCRGFPEWFKSDYLLRKELA